MAHRQNLQRDCAGEPLLPLYKICPVCFWEDDDGAQFRWPTMGGGAN
ncbi:MULTISPECIES: CPCC family cysteine-rich protein [Streptomyces]|nr:MULTISPECIES: CPCC family cysteine-rich protein [Streptomyces]WUC86936.1 CPCC family cysteine-rich protein [Streptomyces anulatus]WUD89099.1 CPCC family cysteine-rich protein [Streptomyces anulatus]